MRQIVIITFALYALGAARAHAQDPPRFVINTRGPVTTVQALAFSADSTRLYAAGFDKVVFGYELVERRGTVTARLVQTLRWDIARGQRGAIYTLAPSPIDRDLVLGGVSGRDGNGDMVIYDTAAAQVRRALRAKDPERNVDGHDQPVAALAWSPNGALLASASIDGELRVWTAPNWETHLLRRKLAPTQIGAPFKTDQVYPVEFLSNTVLAAAVTSSGQLADAGPGGAPAVSEKPAHTAFVTLYDLAQPNPAPVALATPHQQQVTAIARDRNSPRWATADWSGRVYLWEGTAANQQPRVIRHEGGIVTDMDFGPNGTLLVLTHPEAGQCWLELRDAAADRLIDPVAITRIEENFGCLAVSPDGRWVATSGEDDSAVLVFELRNAQGRMAEKPLSGAPPIRQSGRGYDIGRVAFAADGTLRLGFGRLERFFDTYPTARPGQGVPIPNKYGEVTTAFQLGEGALIQDGLDKVRWYTPEDYARGWSIAADPKNLYKLYLYDAARQFVSTITLDPNRQGKARCFTWLGAGQQPWGIAIGTDHQHGVFVYQVVGGGAECPLLRYYRDHAGAVTSISMSGNGRFLASGSLDHTIKLWSLEGVLDVDRRFSRASAWGAVVGRNAQGVQVETVRQDGIAARRGLRVGDRIVRVEIGEQDFVDPAQMHAELQKLPPFETVVVTVQRGNQPPFRILLVPAWEPVATLFVDGTEWALATPQGPYLVSTQGDDLFGWHINVLKADQPEGMFTPQFFLAEQFRKELERPGILRELFSPVSVGNLPGTLERMGITAALTGDLRTLVKRVADLRPQVRVLEPLDGQLFPQGDVRVRVAVDYPTPLPGEGYRYVAYVNGIPHAPLNPPQPGQKTVEFQFAAPDPNNALVVKVEQAGDAQAPAFDAAVVHFRAAAADRPKPKLHMLLLAASKYGLEGQNLKHAVKDAEALQQALLKGDLYQPGAAISLLETGGTIDALAQAIRDLQARLAEGDPRDVLVVVIAGHGEIVDSRYYFVPGGVDLRDQKQIRERGIGWEQLAALAELRCRKVLLLDTCNAGNLLGADDARQAIRPFAREQVFVLTASGVNEVAQELADDHGVFAQTVLEALRGTADGGVRDKEIDLNELARHVLTQVPQKTQAFRRQNPMVFPHDLSEVAPIPLTRYE